MEISFSGVEASEIPRLHEIRAAAFAPVFRSFRDIVGEDIAGIALAKAEIEQADYLDALCKPDTPEQVHVARVGGEIVGFVTQIMDMETKVGEVGLNAVDPEYAGQGIGTQMFEFVLARMKDAGMQVATVGTGGDDSHAPARRAYEKVGFGPAIPNMYMYRKL